MYFVQETLFLIFDGTPWGVACSRASLPVGLPLAGAQRSLVSLAAHNISHNISPVPEPSTDPETAPRVAILMMHAYSMFQ